MDKPDKNIKNSPPNKTTDLEENSGSASKSKNRGRKRKRQDSGSSTDAELLPENALEVEKNLQTVALKNNLDDASVKKILKKVVTNDHVLALVKIREEEEIALSKEEDSKPKLTRAKAKELMAVSPNSAPSSLELTPIKHIPVKTKTEVEAAHCSELYSSKVVTSDQLLALVKLREEKEIALSKEENPKPKLTRAKAKELMGVSPNSAPWNLELTPIKHIPVKTRPEVEALITKELPDDEDDDEYKPTHDDVPSDDDQTLESCSDFDSQPPTPGAPLTPHTPHTSSPQVTQDGPFKVPQQGASTPARRKLVIAEEEEATIALRTRSKLSLSATPIEHIESSFVPPDDVPMPIGDDLWSQFLEECLNPAETSKNEDDDEADPEYNVAADPDAHDEDEDNLENSSILRISKKELNDLVTELFSIMPEDVADPLAITHNTTPTGTWEGKQEPISDEEREKQSQITQKKKDTTIRTSIGKSETEDPEISEQKRDSTIRAPIGKSKMEDPDCQEGEKEKTSNNKENRNKKTRAAKTKMSGNKGLKAVNIQVEEQNTLVQPATSVESEPPPLLKTFQEQTNEVNTRELTVNVDSTVKILPEQVLILQQQLRQHIQLAASNYLQLYVNPAHWKLAPPYKGYLEQFNEMVEKNPNSVVNVCNLQPALDLAKSWESTVCEDTPQNKEMVEFVQSEAERSRRRYASNGYYVGNFPEMFMKVVANSTVFQYPYLLPTMPYRADNSKKFGYRLPEDELIAIGLDQFWQYVEDNPDMFKKPRNYVQGRWGLVAACNLMAKHMFPWNTSKWLQYHIHKARKNKDNPIARFFNNREVRPVEHKLLPYNPKLTLYEQPEYEMPKNWIRYLAKSSKRFRYHYYRRAGTGAPPQGVPVTVDVQEPIKNPLPPDFTKTIVCYRRNVKPKEPEVSQDKFDLVMVPNATGPMLTINPITSTNSDNVISVENPVEMGITRTDEVIPVKTNSTGKVAIPDIRPKVTNEKPTSNVEVTGRLVPVSISKLIPSAVPSYNNSTTKNYTAPAQLMPSAVPSTINSITDNYTTPEIAQSLLTNMFQVVQTSLGSYLIPFAVQNTNTVNSITAPISSTNIVNNLPESSNNEENIPESSKNNTITRTRQPEDIDGHCQCCILIKKICKEKQARITDFFKPKKKEEKPCECSHRKFPKITKRLRMLVDNYKSRSWCEQRRIKSMLSSAERGKSKNDGQQRQSEKDDEDECSLEDIEYVTTYHMKLTRRSTLSKNVYLKTRVNLIFSKFDPDVGNPITLSEQLFEAFDVDLVDLHKEFLGFLTPEQADIIDRFKDYFVHSCVGDLVKRIESEIQNKEDREAVLSKLNEVFTDNVSSSCEICAAILATLTSYPRLAKHVFSLFPHRVVRDKKRCEIDTSKDDAETEEAITKKRLEEAENVDILNACDETLVVMDYEADDSSSEEYNEENKSETAKQETEDMKDEDASSRDSTDITIEESVISKTETHDTSVSTEMSPLVMSEDDQETEIKAEWNRNEDKFILELLLKYVTPEARKDRTIIEILEDNNVYQIIADKCPQKCIDDVKTRVMHILNILVVNNS